MESNGIHVYFNLIYLLGYMFILISYHVYFNLIVYILYLELLYKDKVAINTREIYGDYKRS